MKIMAKRIYDDPAGKAGYRAQVELHVGVARTASPARTG
jgi:hypothetical protein